MAEGVATKKDPKKWAAAKAKAKAKMGGKHSARACSSLLSITRALVVSTRVETQCQK